MNVGDRVTLTLKEDCASPTMKPSNAAPATVAAPAARTGGPQLGEEFYVLFCPAQEATVIRRPTGPW